MYNETASQIDSVKEVPKIEMSLESLNNVVDVLRDKVNLLENRLRPLLIPNIELTKKGIVDSPEIPSVHSPIRGRIDAMRVKIENSVNQLELLINKMEI